MDASYDNAFATRSQPARTIRYSVRIEEGLWRSRVTIPVGTARRALDSITGHVTLDITPVWGIPVCLPADDSVWLEADQVQLVRATRLLHEVPHQRSKMFLDRSVVALWSQEGPRSGTLWTRSAEQAADFFLACTGTREPRFVSEKVASAARREIAAPTPLGWREVRRESHANFETLEFASIGSSEGCVGVQHSENWIRRPGGEWRSGWSW